MKLLNLQGQLAEGNSSTFSGPSTIRLRRAKNPADTPVSQQVLSWLLFWPMLTLIARQVVYFTGPATTAEAFQNGAAMAGQRGSHYYLYVYFLFLLGFVLTGHQQVWITLRRNPLIAAMLALAVVSALWSPIPIVTLQMSIQVGLCTLFACYLSARFTSERLMELVIFMGVCASLLTIVFVFALPSYGLFQGYGGGAWQGICDHKNTLGITSAFLFTPVFFTRAYSTGRRLMYSGGLLLLIYMSQSRGAWLDTLGMILFVAWLSIVRRVRSQELAPLLLVTAALGVVSVAFGVHFWPLLTRSIGKDPTMTGRAQIYVEIMRSVMKHPFLGYGFGAFWYTGNPEFQRIALALRWPNIGYAESGILEMSLQTGFFGSGLVVLMIGKALAQGARLLRSPHYSPRVGWYLTVFFLAMLTNIDAGWFMTANTLDWALIVTSCIGMNAEMGRFPTAA